MMQLLYGTVTAVNPPGSPNNNDGYQYEYSVLVVGPNYAAVPLSHVIKSDAFGAFDEYDDATLKTGQKVLVACLRDYSLCAIVGAIRNTKTLMTAVTGHHWTRRFNKFTQQIDSSGNYSAKSDSGPNLNVTTTTVLLDDAAGDNILLDAANKVLTINANAWTVNVQGDVNITVKGNVNVKCSDAVVDADSVTLAGDDGDVVTTATYPSDYVTGIPIMGSTKVKAGT